MQRCSGKSSLTLSPQLPSTFMPPLLLKNTTIRCYSLCCSVLHYPKAEQEMAEGALKLHEYKKLEWFSKILATTRLRERERCRYFAFESFSSQAPCFNTTIYCLLHYPLKSSTLYSSPVKSSYHIYKKMSKPSSIIFFSDERQKTHFLRTPSFLPFFFSLFPWYFTYPLWFIVHFTLMQVPVLYSFPFP